MKAILDDNSVWTGKSSATCIFWGKDMKNNLDLHQKEAIRQDKIEKIFIVLLFIFTSASAIFSYLGIDKCTAFSAIKICSAVFATLSSTLVTLMAKFRPGKLAENHKEIVTLYTALIAKIEITLTSMNKPDPEVFFMEIIDEYKHICSKDVPPISGLKSPADLIVVVATKKALNNMKKRGGSDIVDSDYIGSSGAGLFDVSISKFHEEEQDEINMIRKFVKGVKKGAELREVVISDKKDKEEK